MMQSPTEIASSRLAMQIAEQTDKEISEAASRFFGHRNWGVDEFAGLSPGRWTQPSFVTPGESCERVFFLGRPALELRVRVSFHEGRICAAIEATHLLPPVPGEAPLPPPVPSG